MLNNKNTLNKKDFDKFINEEMIVKEHKQYFKLIEERLDYIISQICKYTHSTCHAYDFDINEMEIDELKGKDIYYENDFIVTNPLRLDKYDKNFPVKWLYTDFEDDLIKECLLYENQLLEKLKISEQKKIEKNTKYNNIKENIISKLTEEELMYITFISMNDVLTKKREAQKETEKKLAYDIKILQLSGFNVTDDYQAYSQECIRNKAEILDFYKWFEQNQDSYENKSTSPKLR